MIFGKYINKYYLKNAPILILGLAALILVDYFQLFIPELYRMVINGMNGDPVLVNGQAAVFDMEFLLDQVCRPMIITIIVMVVGRFLWRVCFFGSAIRVVTDLRTCMFAHSKELSQEYYQVNKVGNLMSLYTNDLDTVQECFGDGILMFCDALFLGLLAVIKMWRMNHFLTGLSMIPMAFLMAAGTTLGKYLMKKWEERQAAFSELSDFAQENYSGLAVIKAFVKETKELMMFRRLNRENEDINVEYTKISTLLNIMVTLFVESVICVILGYGGYLVYCGSFDAGQLVEYIGYFSAVVWPIMAVSMLIEKTSRGKASLNRITELLDAKVDVKDRGGVQDLPSIHGKIEFRNLTFRYPDGEYDVLKNVSFTIEPGESVGIVGKTGSGKTTIVDLLLRTYNVPDGTLFIDDHDVNTVSIHSVREGCAYVPQDNFLFSDTISGNISFAFDDENQEAIEDAAMMSDVHDNIAEFKEGYRTVLGERGVTVSGGQKQRISIARALMKHAPILILDDSVSAVDTKTERTILDNLKKREGLTTILIAHRISTVEQMDKIVFVEDGEVHAVGKHEDLFVHIERLSHEQLNEIPVGKLVTRTTNDTNAISLMFTNLLVNLLKNFFVIIGILIAMLFLNYELTLMVLCFVPFIVLFSIIFRKFSRRAHRKVKDCTTDINTYLSENLSGMKITQIFNREDAKMREFTDKSNALGRAQQEQIFVFGIFRPLVYMLYISSVLCLLYLGGKGYLEGTSFLGQTLTSGMIVSFYMYISKFFNPIQNLAEQFNWLQSAFASAEKVFSILDLEPKMQDAPDAIELTGIRGEIEFRDVWFSYIPGEWVLKGVSFHVNPKETIAFVGSTGSGKSTILSLICRNYEFQKGEILIDGIDIRKIKIDSLRKKFGQMLQDVFLFSGTIRSNIILREEGISDEEIMDVCHYVNADQFINKLDHGLDEPVRERGNNFSAGQRQLLSFARTIIHKPSLMILDEATANIDTETELLIQDSMEKMKNIGTMLIVAHRLSTIQHADEIIVLSHGKIVEHGTHQELLAAQGRYYQLYTLQYHREQSEKQRGRK